MPAPAPAPDPLLASGYFREAGNPLMEFVVRLKPSELEALGHAIVVTYACYARYFDELGKIGEGARDAPRLIKPASFDYGPACVAAEDAALRAASVALIEKEVMQWTPLRDVCVQQPPADVVYKYEPVHVDGRPYLQCTAAGDMRPMQRIVARRLVFLNEALLAVARLHDLQQWKVQAPGAMVRGREASPWADDAWLLLQDIVAILDTLLGLVMRAMFFALIFLAQGSPFAWKMAAGAIALFAIVQGVLLVRKRRRERAESAAPPAPPAPPAPNPAAEPEQTDAAVLELPHLPARVPSAPWYLPEHWLQTAAWSGLAYEEAQMGFEHVPTSDATQRIHWATLDYTQPVAENVPPRAAPSWLFSFVMLPLFLCVVTLHPRVEELRSDAIALRREAICSLAQKWERLVASGKEVRRSKPLLLQHPYAARVLAMEAERQRRAE